MSLDVFMHGRRIGALYPSGWKKYSFAYSLDVLERVPLGTPLLSYSLPVRGEPYAHSDIRPYVDGLLPEGERRHQIAKELGIFDTDDSYALISALGRDCPGAVTFISKGMALDPSDPDELVWLDEDDLEELVGEEPDWLCDPEDERRMRFALPGQRHKLALVYDEQEDRWGWPSPGVPSTHIVKPQADGQEGMAFSEMVCTLALREMGLPVAHAEVMEISGRPCLVSKRFDRWGEGTEAQRLHQESFSQALGFAPEEVSGRGPGYAETTELLEAIGEGRTIESLFIVGYCNFLLGNYDEPHGKNCSLLYTEVGPIVAPFYDIASTALFEDPTTLRTIEEAVKRNSCLVGLTPIGIECGYALQPALELGIATAGRLVQGLGSIAARAHEEGWYEPHVDQVLQRVMGRFESFGEEMEILRRPPQLPPPRRRKDDKGDESRP